MEKNEVPTERRAHWWLSVSTFIYLAVAGMVSVHCYRNSMFDIDLLGYSATVALADTGDIVKAHEIVYSTPLTPHLRGLDGDGKQALDMRRRAADPYYAALHFPYFAIKPLYILTLEAVHKLGVSVIDSSRTVSSLFYFGIAVMLWVYTRSWLAVVVMILPEVMLVGQANEPDSMSCFLMLLGLWMVFLKRYDMGLLPLLLAIWVRPENVLLCMLVILALLIQGRLDWKKASVMALVGVGSDVLINHYGYTLPELYGHFLGGGPGAGAAFALANYGRSLVQGAHDGLHSPVPVFFLLWLVCFPIVGREFRWIMGITLIFSVGRFVLFPPYEPRYYPLFFVTTSLAAVLVATRTPLRRWVLGQHLAG